MSDICLINKENPERKLDIDIHLFQMASSFIRHLARPTFNLSKGRIYQRE